VYEELSEFEFFAELPLEALKNREWFDTEGVSTYLKNKLRHTSIDHPEVQEDAEKAREIAKLIKLRLATAGLLVAYPCAWCLPQGTQS
jgi:hypothetical protein